MHSLVFFFLERRVISPLLYEYTSLTNLNRFGLIVPDYNDYLEFLVEQIPNCSFDDQFVSLYMLTNTQLAVQIDPEKTLVPFDFNRFVNPYDHYNVLAFMAEFSLQFLFDVLYYYYFIYAMRYYNFALQKIDYGPLDHKCFYFSKIKV